MVQRRTRKDQPRSAPQSKKHGEEPRLRVKTVAKLVKINYLQLRHSSTCIRRLTSSSLAARRLILAVAVNRIGFTSGGFTRCGEFGRYKGGEYPWDDEAGQVNLEQAWAQQLVLSLAISQALAVH